MRTRAIFAAAAALFLARLPAAAQSTATLKGVDLYRSQAVTLGQIRKAVGPLLDSYLRQAAENKKSHQKIVARLKAQVEESIKQLGPVAEAKLSFNQYATSGERTAYLTIDVVDEADLKTRRPFAPAPTGSALDPEGLLAVWQRYSDLGEQLTKEGRLSTGEHPACPAFFCLWGSVTPELGELEKKLIHGAPANKKPLLDVLAKDADPRKRAAALYVLTYITDGKTVVDAAQDQLRDPSEEVRAAALQVLAEIALYHKAYFLDVSKIIPLLDYPTVSDRQKALAVLVGLADNPSYKPYVTARGTPYLLGLLQLKQPANQDLAYTLLATISQESFDRRDVESWRKWVETHAAKDVPLPLPGVQVE